MLERVETLEMRLEALSRLANLTQYVDANGWTVGYRLDGKREWRQRWLAVATSAAVASFAVSGADLPVGVATQAQVHVESCEIRTSSSTWAFNARVQGGEATTTLSVVMGTVDGSFQTVYVASADIFVTLVER